MSNVYEFKELFHHAQTAWQKNEQTVLVILTDVKGSAYRLPGSKMLMTSAGQMYGTLSGGCLEADLYEWAEKVFETNQPLLHRYDLSDTEIWSLGIGCKGNLQFLFLPISSTDSLWVCIQHLLQQEEPFTLIVDTETGNSAVLGEDSSILVADDAIPASIISRAGNLHSSQTRAQLLSENGRCYYIDAIKRSEHLVIAGAGQDAMPLAKLAHKAGFSVTVLDARAHFNNTDRFPHAEHVTTPVEQLSNGVLKGSWWVVMNHHQERDEEALRLAIESNAKYIGVLGPTYRTDEMLRNIGHSLSSGPIHSPVGLDIGAETIDEVAISIISEIMSLRANCTPRHLHGKEKIHG